jgi:alcohol dehydrogenase class IV
LAHSLKEHSMPGITTAIELLRPSVIEFGPGVVPKLGDWARARGGTRTLVVTGAFNAARVSQLGLPGTVKVFGGVLPEPDVANFEAALAAADDFAPDLVVGFGGGSVMDIAKLVAALAGSEQKLADVVGPEKVHGRRIGLAQVPTTAGTGSEVGTRALVTDPVSRNKWAVQSRFMLADIAVVDPDLMRTLSPQITAETGVDAMAHCVEAYTSLKAHPIIDVYALEGVRLIGRHLGAAVRDGQNQEARAGLALASLYGGLCLGPVNTAGGHAIAYPLGTRHKIAHGAANAVIFPHALAYNAPVAPGKTAAILAALGLPVSADPGPVQVAASRYCQQLGIEMRMSQRGVPSSDLAAMAAEAFAIKRLIDNNPRPLTEAAIRDIYQQAF